MLRYGMREHDLLKILTLQHETFRRVLMGDSCHILLYDGTCIEFRSHIVARCTDDLHSALVGLVIGFRTYEEKS